MTLLAVAVVTAVSAQLAACTGGDDPAPDVTATESPSAVPTVTELALPSPSPTSTPTGTMETPWPPALGIEPVDEALVALRAGEWAPLLALVQPLSGACTTAIGAGGPPKCPEGTADGTEIEYFPFFECDGWGGAEGARNRLVDDSTHPIAVVGWVPAITSQLTDRPISHTIILARAVGEGDPADEARLLTTLGFNDTGLGEITADCGAYSQSKLASGELFSTVEGGRVLWHAHAAPDAP